MKGIDKKIFNDKIFLLSFLRDAEKIKNHMIEPQPGNIFKFNGSEVSEIMLIIISPKNK